MNKAIKEVKIMLFCESRSEAESNCFGDETVVPCEGGYLVMSWSDYYVYQNQV